MDEETMNIRTTDAVYDNRFTGERQTWEISYEISDDPPKGTMKKVFFSTDGQWAICFFHYPERAVQKGIPGRIKAILGQYNPTLSREEGGASDNTPEQAAYYRTLYCWPVATVDDPEFGFGIVCPKYPEKFLLGDDVSIYQNLSQLWKGQEKKPKWFFEPKLRERLKERELGDFLRTLQICVSLARSVRRLHSAGLAHSDLSFNNVLVDPVTGSSIIIDIDSLVVPCLYPPEVMGTPTYVAPEVLETQELPFDDPDKNLPCIATDLHAMAVLIYQLLLLRHPLDGPKTYDDDPEQDAQLMYGMEALFIEDPEDTSNRPAKLDVTIHDMGPKLEALFVKALSKGLHKPRLRPQASEWEYVLEESMDLLYPCPNGNCEMGYFILHDFQKPQCPFCHTAVEPRDVTRMIQKTSLPGRNGQWTRRGEVNLYDGKALYRRHFYPNCAAEETLTPTQVAAVESDGERLFLVNLTLPDLSLENGDPIAPGERVELCKGTRLCTSPHEGGMLIDIVRGDMDVERTKSL